MEAVFAHSFCGRCLILIVFYVMSQQQKLIKPSPKKRKGHFFKLRFGSGRKISAPTGETVINIYFL